MVHGPLEVGSSKTNLGSELIRYQMPIPEKPSANLSVPLESSGSPFPRKL